MLSILRRESTYDGRATKKDKKLKPLMDQLFAPCKKGIIDSAYQEEFLDVRTMERFFK